jgi:exopolysaccharide production protein ExoY
VRSLPATDLDSLCYPHWLIFLDPGTYTCKRQLEQVEAGQAIRPENLYQRDGMRLAWGCSRVFKQFRGLDSYGRGLRRGRTHRNGAISPVIASGTKPCAAVVKRCFDVLTAALGLVFLAPLLAVAAIVIVLTDGGLPIFSHRRCGHNGRLFHCYKLRTMVVGADEKLSKLLAKSPKAAAEWARDHKLRRDPRITWFGTFLRRSSIDELPQLINVIKGEMSLVGPRPIVVEEIERYGELFRIYSLARPGITGLWQVSGRNHTTSRRRVELDARYVREWSFRGDMGIILKTLPAVLFSRGAF